MDYDIHQLVNQLLSAEWGELDEACNRLVEYGEEAIPQLIDAIYDDRFDVRHSGVHFAQPNPIEAILSIFVELGVFGLAEHVVHCLSLNSISSKEVGRALGRIARDDCIDPLIHLLDDDDYSVLSATCNGISRGAKRLYCSPRFKADLYPHVQDRVADSGEAVHALFALDQDRATKLLNTEDYLSAEFPEVYHVLRELGDRDIPISPALLFRLRDEVKAPITYSVVMKSLARNGQDVFRDILDRIDLKNPRPSIVYIQALKFIENDEAMNLLIRLCDSDDELVSSTAHRLLALKRTNREQS